MGLIVSANDIIKKLLIEQGQLARDLYTGGVWPIYGADKKGRPEPLGSSMIIEINETVYLLTAAHVIDHHIDDQTTLYLVADGYEKLEFDFLATKAPESKRDNDRFDFAFCSLPKEYLAKLPAISPINHSDLFLGETEPYGTCFTILGYPRSKNKKLINPEKKKVKTSMFSYSSYGAQNLEMMAEINCSSSTHVLLPFDGKYSLNEDGQRVPSINPRGISGGALVNVGNLAKFETLATETLPRPKVAGLFIEFYKEKKYTVSTRLKTIIEEICGK